MVLRELRDAGIELAAPVARLVAIAMTAGAIVPVDPKPQDSSSTVGLDRIREAGRLSDHGRRDGRTGQAGFDPGRRGGRVYRPPPEQGNRAGDEGNGQEPGQVPEEDWAHGISTRWEIPSRSLRCGESLGEECERCFLRKRRAEASVSGEYRWCRTGKVHTRGRSSQPTRNNSTARGYRDTARSRSGWFSARCNAGSASIRRMASSRARSSRSLSAGNRA